MSNKVQFGFIVEYDTFAIVSDKPMAGKTELYWLVDDVEATFNELSQKAEVSLPLTQRPFGKVFGINDPDGRTRFLLEFAKERPSQLAQ